ncbi:hypothetical protein ILUMI_24771 [Ignelater luminosus]|uniref:Uncharacterized protein n=1 Tax=Ignelater luminosus TaxID=2038154 RepID=A0A8K0FYF6_IGNLU|nr:hypothetical protein ILUMI_24771 [Ignelater luminosus]
MVVAKLRLKEKKRRRGKIKSKTWNVEKLKTEVKQEEYRKEAEEEIKEVWMNYFKKILNEKQAAEEIIIGKGNVVVV